MATHLALQGHMATLRTWNRSQHGGKPTTRLEGLFRVVFVSRIQYIVSRALPGPTRIGA